MKISKTVESCEEANMIIYGATELDVQRFHVGTGIHITIKNEKNGDSILISVAGDKIKTTGLLKDDDSG